MTIRYAIRACLETDGAYYEIPCEKHSRYGGFTESCADCKGYSTWPEGNPVRMTFAVDSDRALGDTSRLSNFDHARDYRWPRWRRACRAGSRCKPREAWGYVPAAVASQPFVVGNPRRGALLACGATLTGGRRILDGHLPLRGPTGTQCRSSRCSIGNCRSSRRHA